MIHRLGGRSRCIGMNPGLRSLSKLVLFDDTGAVTAATRGW